MQGIVQQHLSLRLYRQDLPAETAVKAGESIVLIGDASNTLYCAEPTKPTIGNCRATSIAPKRQVITKETSTDESQ